ncbi:MAG TPA: hypothetical protein VFB58_07370 [Chloroflexota bacterium]|nr:hypothetical protein [Chloroflexota bacterium]
MANSRRLVTLILCLALEVATLTVNGNTSAAARTGLAAQPPSRVHESTNVMRPTSYRVTLVRESKPGAIRDPNLHMYPPYPLFPGLSLLQVTVQWQGGKWQESDRWLVAPPHHTSSLARLTTVPLPSTSASDGHRIWIRDPIARTITVYPSDAAGTWPGTEGDLKQFTVWPSVSALLQSNFHCTKPIRHADRRIAGRSVYVLEFGQDQCRHLSGGRYANQSRLLDGRIVVWVDRATHFTLRANQYAFDHPEHLILSWHVTSIRYNLRLSPRLFQLVVPTGYKLVHGK